MIKLAEFTNEKIKEIIFKVRIAINEVHKQNFNEDGIRIQIPTYFTELLINYNHHMLHGFQTPLEEDETFFGVKVVPGYENFIVVYHKDMPLYQNTSYQVIDLK